MWQRVMVGMGWGLFSLLAGMVQTAALAEEAAITDRSVLPLPEPQYPPITELDVRNVTPPPRFAVTAPADAPNVLIVLIDDFGFGQSSVFGGPIPMPTVERLAQNGLRYNQFHTTAVCSATRMALLTGRNHHSGNMGSITEAATAFPGNTGARPNSVAPLAEMLRLNGYAPPHLVNTTRPPRGKSAPPDRPTAGRPARASTSSTVSSAAKPINGPPWSTMA